MRICGRWQATSRSGAKACALSVKREDITRALRIDIASGKTCIVEAAAIGDPQNDRYYYFCADCAEKGHRVRLACRGEQEHTAVFERLDPRTGLVRTDKNNRPLEREINTSLTMRFNRWPDSPEHRCDNQVRYAALKQIGLRLNATRLDRRSFVFPVHVPGQSWARDEAHDIRKTFRPRAMGFNRLDTADSMIRLLDVLQKDPGLHLDQKFDDGKTVRGFTEFYYEGPEKLYADLKDAEQYGRSQARTVACLVDANTSAFALRDPANRGCVIDRSMPKIGDTERLHLLVRPMNRRTTDDLFKASRIGSFDKQPLIVLGEAYLAPEKTGQVEIEIFTSSQFALRNNAFRFLSKYGVKTESHHQLNLI